MKEQSFSYSNRITNNLLCQVSMSIVHWVGFLKKIPIDFRLERDEVYRILCCKIFQDMTLAQAHIIFPI